MRMEDICGVVCSGIGSFTWTLLSQQSYEVQLSDYALHIVKEASWNATRILSESTSRRVIYRRPVVSPWLRTDKWRQLCYQQTAVFCNNCLDELKWCWQQWKDTVSNTSWSDNVCHICDVCGCNCRSLIGLFSLTSQNVIDEIRRPDGSVHVRSIAECNDKVITIQTVCKMTTATVFCDNVKMLLSSGGSVSVILYPFMSSELTRSATMLSV